MSLPEPVESSKPGTCFSAEIREQPEVDPLFPVWTIASHDQTLSAVQEASQRAREFGSTIVACGNAADAIEGADYRLPVPSPGSSSPPRSPAARDSILTGAA